MQHIWGGAEPEGQSTQISTGNSVHTSPSPPLSPPPSPLSYILVMSIPHRHAPERDAPAPFACVFALSDAARARRSRTCSCTCVASVRRVSIASRDRDQRACDDIASPGWCMCHCCTTDEHTRITTVSHHRPTYFTVASYKNTRAEQHTK